MRLITLLAGYAAGLAVAMKVRRDAGQSKLDSQDPNKTTLDKLVDEVKDIHESTFKDVKAYVSNHFSDVHDFDSLKVKVTSIVDNIATEADEYLSSLKEKGGNKKEDIEGKVDTFFTEKEAILEEAKNKGLVLADTTAETVIAWIEMARKRLLSLRDTVKARLETEGGQHSSPKTESISKKPQTRKKVVKKASPKTPKA